MYNIPDAVREILVDYDTRIDKPKIEDSDTLNDLSLDSLDHVEVILDLEDDFDIEIPDDSWTALTTVAELIEIVRKLIEKDEGIFHG